MKTLSILGSTGSIGVNTLDVVSQLKDDFKIVSLTGGGNVDLLIEQAKAFCPEFVAISDERFYKKLKDTLSPLGIEVACGESGIVEAATRHSDIVMSSIVGFAGLKPTMAALQRGARVALANKECLVCAGDMMIETAKKCGAEIIPVDSEHSAIFQVLEENPEKVVKNIILTASGGPFRKLSGEELKYVTPEQAVKHPNWSMGRKISVDSATMMNKGLELIEAYYLFGLGVDKLSVVIHPQSYIHSVVEYVDGSFLAQLGAPDMRTPISYALSYPDRFSVETKPFSFVGSAFTFEEVDTDRFPLVRLAYDVMTKNNGACITFNAAGECAVYAFLEGKISYLDIMDFVSRAINEIRWTSCDSLEAVYEMDAFVRKEVNSWILSM